MIVAVGNTKGGVGKTTLAVQIALRRAMTGRKVWFIDGDRQGSSADALMGRSVPSGILVSRIAEGKQLVREVDAGRGTDGDIVIDVGGRDSTALRGALTVADLVLVPFMPSALDLWALQDMKQLCDQATVRRLVAVVNAADQHGARIAYEAAKGLGLRVAETVLHRRRAFLTATGDGLCVWETPSRHRNKQACAELDGLIEEIFA